jgi:hypothetical protein
MGLEFRRGGIFDCHDSAVWTCLGRYCTITLCSWWTTRGTGSREVKRQGEEFEGEDDSVGYPSPNFGLRWLLIRSREGRKFPRNFHMVTPVGDEIEAKVRMTAQDKYGIKY